jgi:hypothetical protein
MAVKISDLTPLAGNELASGDLFETTDVSASESKKITAENLAIGLAPFYYPRTDTEIANSITPTDYRYPPGNVMRYGAVADGDEVTPTDNLTAFNNAVLAGETGGTSNRGWTITIPRGDFYLSDTWHIYQHHTIIGAGGAYMQPDEAATILWFPQDTTGIRLYTSGYASPNGSAYHTSIRDLAVVAKAKGTTGHGIFATTSINMTNVYVGRFKEHGIYILAFAVGSGDGSDGLNLSDANLWRLYACGSTSNDGCGLYVRGADANAGSAIGCNFKTNGQWGIYDSSNLGNTYISCHINDNGDGSDGYGTIKTDSQSTFLDCYTEVGGKAGCEIAPGTLLIGGFTAGVENFPRAVICNADGSELPGNGLCTMKTTVSGGGIATVVVTNPGASLPSDCIIKVDDRTLGATKYGGSSGTGAVLTPNIVGGKLMSVTITDPGEDYEGSNRNGTRIIGRSEGIDLNGPVYMSNTLADTDHVKIIFGQFNGGLMMLEPALDSGNQLGLLNYDASYKCYNMSLGTGGTTMRRIVGYGTTALTGGRSSGLTPGATMYPSGIWLGDTTTGRNIRSASAMPTSGEYAQGDFVFNTAPAEAGSSSSKYVILGWSRLTTGTGHTLNTDWVQCRCLTGN